MTAGTMRLEEELAGHSNIATTGNIYAGWSIDQLAGTMAQVLAG